MEIFKEISKQKTKTALAVGCFDGVHVGHAAVLNAAQSYAKENGAAFCVLMIYFDADRPEEKGKGDLSTLAEREVILESMGVERLFEIPLSEIKELDGERFVSDILSDGLCAAAVFVGNDFRFGAGRACGVDELKAYCERNDIEAFPIAEVLYGGEPVSTSRIKAALARGDAADAKAMLVGRDDLGAKTMLVGRDDLGAKAMLVGRDDLGAPF